MKRTFSIVVAAVLIIGVLVGVGTLINRHDSNRVAQKSVTSTDSRNFNTLNSKITPSLSPELKAALQANTDAMNAKLAKLQKAAQEKVKNAKTPAEVIAADKDFQSELQKVVAQSNISAANIRRKFGSS